MNLKRGMWKSKDRVKSRLNLWSGDVGTIV